MQALTACPAALAAAPGTCYKPQVGSLAVLGTGRPVAAGAGTGRHAQDVPGRRCRTACGCYAGSRFRPRRMQVSAPGDAAAG
jgi:hypothetical protein